MIQNTAELALKDMEIERIFAAANVGRFSMAVF